jgi:serine/threonine protein kinase
MLQPDPQKRFSIEEALLHPWINAPDQVPSKVHRQNTIDELRKFNARRKIKVGVAVEPLAFISVLCPFFACCDCSHFS